MKIAQKAEVNNKIRRQTSAHLSNPEAQRKKESEKVCKTF